VSGASRTAASRLFPETGYAVFRGGNGGHAVFDVGPHGYMNGGHAHADALSMTLSLGGRPFLVDPGTATYTMRPRVRDRFRSSQSHNTLTIDHESQARPKGPFHWHTRANAAVHGWRLHPRLDWVEASHDGYAPVTHRRSVVRADDGWLVVDDVLGVGPHTAAAHWHLDPRWTLRTDGPRRLRADDRDGSQAWILYDAGEVFLAHGDEDSGLGWYAPAYGVIERAWTARVTRAADAPFTMLTWIGTTPLDTRGGPSMERLSPVCEAGDVAVAARVTTGERSSVFVVCPSSTASHHGCASDIGEYRTDARVFHAIEQGGRLNQLDLVDGSQVLTRRGGGVSICSNAPMPDLHLTMVDGLLDLQTSQPPTQLRIDSSPASRIVAIRLNHRERILPPDHDGTFLVYGADWAGPVRDLLPSLA
jgi:hypothetical protein